MGLHVRRCFLKDRLKGSLGKKSNGMKLLNKEIGDCELTSYVTD